jgi:GNAT superfamily N-acetyltransferase
MFPMIKTVEDIQTIFPSAFLLNAVNESHTIVGAVHRVPPAVPTIYKLAVLPQHQKQGLGHRLIQAIQDEFPRRNFKLIVAGTELQNGQCSKKKQDS